MEFVTLTKEILNTYIDVIIDDTINFEYNNWEKENFFFDLPDKWELSIAILNSNSICGFSINSRKSDIFYIHFFYILKKFRNAKMGAGLLSECEKKAKETNLNAVQLKCNKNNSGAMNFYLRNGFVYIKSDPYEKALYYLEKKINS